MEDIINNKIRVKVGPSGIFRTIAVKKQDLEKIKNHILEKRKKSSVIEQSSISPVEKNIVTPAELLANELTEPKIQEEVNMTSNDITINEETINTESDQTKPQQEKNLDNISNDLVLRIINEISQIQVMLDSIGEKVINLSDFYQVFKEDKTSNIALQIIEKPVENKVESLLNDIEKQPLTTENIKEISPFSVEPESSNIFDEPEQTKKVAA